MTGATNLPAGGAGPLPRRGPRTWILVLLGMVIVASGVVIGAGTTVLLLKDRLAPLPTPGERTAARIADELRGRFDLTEEQARQVREIMARRMDAIEKIHRDAREKMAAEHGKLREEMKAVLSPDQFERWSAQFEALRPPLFGPPPGPPGRRPGPGPGMPGGPPPNQPPGLMPNRPPPRAFVPPQDRPPLPGQGPGPDRLRPPPVPPGPGGPRGDAPPPPGKPD
jgi:hypothetical protein